MSLSSLFEPSFLQPTPHCWIHWHTYLHLQLATILHVPAFAIKSHWHCIIKVQMVVNSFSSSPLFFFTNIFCTKWVWVFAALRITKCLTYSVLKGNNIWATSWKKGGGGGRRERGDVETRRERQRFCPETEKRSWKNIFKSIIVHKAVTELHTMRQKLKGNILTFYEKSPIKSKCAEHVCLCVHMYACTFSQQPVTISTRYFLATRP